MAYWVKSNESRDYCYHEEGEKIDYTIIRFYGPFRHLSDAEGQLDRNSYDQQIWEFDG